MRILFSVSYALNFELCPDRWQGHDIKVLPRSSDWGLRGVRKHLHYAREAWHLARMAKGYDAMVLLTTGAETVLVGAFLDAVHSSTRVVCADFLIPRFTPAMKFAGGALRRVDHFVCIRSGDADTLRRRFGIPRSKCSFAHFPCDPRVARMATGDDGYVYSAGWAHRDWRTLMQALEQTGSNAILSVGGSLPKSRSRQIHVLRQRSPKEGRRLMANASLVVLPLAETELPNGPIVLLDAMAMGKALIVTDVNGSRDYVEHGVTAWVVPPGDPAAMADAISLLTENPTLCRSLGCNARERVLAEFTPQRFVDTIVKSCVAE